MNSKLQQILKSKLNWRWTVEVEKSVCYKYFIAFTLEKLKPKWRFVWAQKKTFIVHVTHNKGKAAHPLLFLALFVR